MSRGALVTLALLVGASGCSSHANDTPQPADSGTPDTTSPSDTTVADAPDARETLDATIPTDLLVVVTLDGKPSPSTLVVQGGNPARWTTDADGKVRITVDPKVEGDLFVIASHHDARTDGAFVTGGIDTLKIALTSYDPRDNEAYTFQDPGEPTRRMNTTECAHCHPSINDDWYPSAHRTSASNVVVQDLYAGAAGSFDTKAACDAAGGKFWTGITPGKLTKASRCYVGDGTLPALNPTCGVSSPCDGVATKFGGCANCHAPGIDGKLGGRDLLEAKDLSFDFGMHCDVCHRTESLDLTKEPGSAGRMRLFRPSEPGSPTLGTWDPLMFGPSPDVPNPRMGMIQRDHFKQSTICAGCHEQQQAALVPGTTLSGTRWPSGRLPTHTTYGEWFASPMNPSQTCQSCHMPPNPAVWNSADLQLFFTGGIGVAGGWKRPAGSVRHHYASGPRQPSTALIATGLSVDKKVVSGTLTASVTVTNTGAGHALPTGEPLRSLLVLVEATCGGVRLDPTAGSAVPDFGGYLDRRVSTSDWSTWPGAKVGDVVRVVRRTGKYYDYKGFGPFGDGTFAATDKGMPVEDAVGSSTVTAVAGDKVTFDKPLPSGDVAYRTEGSTLPSKTSSPISWSGSPGFGFARVMVAADGRRMVPHFLAVDVASDNRILPLTSWTSTHQFTSPCTDPVVRAVLVHRAFPLSLARERGWTPRDSIEADVTK